MRASPRSVPLACRAAAALAALLLSGGVGLAQSPIVPLFTGPILMKDTVPQVDGPAPEVVNDVIVQGDRLVPASKIMTFIHTRPGAEYDAETVNEDVRRLYETRQFANVLAERQHVADHKVNVCFHFVEYPNVVQEVVYQGAKRLKTDELASITGIRTGQPLNPTANQLACQAIVRRYNEDGRLYASCELVEGGHTGDTRVVFDIIEGPVARVFDVQFVGNTFVSGKRLAAKVNSTRQGGPLLNGDGIFNPVGADKDVAQLEAYYRSFGFDDVHVSRELQWDADQRHAVLIFHIQEGPRHHSKDMLPGGSRSE